MSPALTFLFAIVGGAAVGNLYWAQPLLAEIAARLDVPIGAASALVTLTQVGYALGIFLIVPLGDTLDRRRLIPAIMICSAVALGASALAPSFPVLLVTFAAVGLTTVAGQLLTPFAGDLALPEERGRVIGTIVSGLLMGILLSRTISGIVADLFGWRGIYILASGVMVVLAAIMWRTLPQDRPRSSVPYPTLLLSVFTTVRRFRAVQATLIIGGSGFAVFSMFWTAITFLLSAPPFAYSTSQIGLVGLVGLAGALAARRAGHLHDRGWSAEGTGFGLVLTLVSLVIADLCSTTIIGILVAVLLLDVAIQLVNVLNQTRLLSVDPAARSRLNTAFVSCNFIGGAIGSLLAGVLWEKGGWSLTMIGAGALIVFALGIWLVFRRELAGIAPNRQAAAS